MDARDELIRRWREGTREDRERIIYFLKLARLREAQKRLNDTKQEPPSDSGSA